MKKVLFCVALGALVAQATTIDYDLANNFSTTSNPNGVWSFLQGTTPLSFFPQPTDGNLLNPAAAYGYFGVASNFTTVPFVMEASEDGSLTSNFTDNDFVAGDILVHSTNPGTGDPVFVDWTAPSAGTITVSGEVWYAHSPAGERSNDYSLTLGGSPIASGTVTFGDGLNNPSIFPGSGTLTVTQGEVLSLELTPSAQQEFGSLAGVDIAVDLTTASTPEPGTTLLLAGALLPMAAVAKRRRTAYSASR